MSKSKQPMTPSQHVFEYLTDHPHRQLPYLEAALVSDEPVLSFLLALRQVARARGKSIQDLSIATDLNRENLYRMLSPKGNPSFANVFALLDSLGLELSVREKRSRKPAGARRAARVSESIGSSRKRASSE